MRPRLLDLFCCQGGASKGFSRAGFDVYGGDLFEDSQKRYPFPSFKGDALAAMDRLLGGWTLPFEGQDMRLSDFAVITASPPCQAYSITKHSHSVTHPDLVGPVRELLQATGLPYVIENVPGAPLRSALTLCGTEFDLTAIDTDGTRLHLKRHRLFESNVALMGAGGCQCVAYKRAGFHVGGVYGGGSNSRSYAQSVRHGGYTPSKSVMADLMGINWMTLHGLSQAIPPAFTEFIGQQVLSSLGETA